MFIAVIMMVVAAGCGSTPDPLRDQQWGLDALKLPKAWESGRGDETVIAVVDTGVDPEHPDLKDHLVDGYDFVDRDADPRDENGHGTHVAGIAGAAPDAKIMPIRVLTRAGTGERNTIAAGIVWAAEHGAKVINLSLGENALMARLLRGGVLNPAINVAARHGAVVVAAAGNDSTLKQPYELTTQVLVVNASDRQGAPARFTNFGAAGAVAAPGVRILSTLPTYRTEMTRDDTSGYGAEDGTSMAAPYVSGLAALLRARDVSVPDTIDAIRRSAANPTRDPRLGLGIVDAAAATSIH